MRFLSLPHPPYSLLLWLHTWITLWRSECNKLWLIAGTGTPYSTLSIYLSLLRCLTNFHEFFIKHWNQFHFFCGWFRLLLLLLLHMWWNFKISTVGSALAFWELLLLLHVWLNLLIYGHRAVSGPSEPTAVCKEWGRVERVEKCRHTILSVAGHALYHCVKRLLTQPPPSAQTHLLCACVYVCVFRKAGEKHVTVFRAFYYKEEFKLVETVNAQQETLLT